MGYLNLRTMERVERPNPSTLDAPVVETPAPTIQQQEYNTSQGGNISSPENTILSTGDYASFKLDRANRPVSAERIERLSDAIGQKNLLHLFPIVVTRNLTIIDGQHRLKAAEALQVPIYYIISDQMRIEDAAAVAQSTAAWKLPDWLHHWCALGLPEYQLLRDFWEAHSWLPLSIATQICHYGDVRREDGTLTRSFALGKYTANDIPFASKVCSMVMDFAAWKFRGWRSATFILAIRQLASNADYDHKRMMQKMQYQSTKLVLCPNLDSYLALLSDIYNFRASEEFRVVFKRMPSNSPKYRIDRKKAK